MKQLVGKWQGTTTPMGPNDKPAPAVTEFRLTSGGSAIEENLAKGSPHEMVDMYTDEGGRLAMTHYCAMGNQPHMKLKQADDQHMVFEMVEAQGITSPDESHMHALTLTLKDKNTLQQDWVNYDKGKPAQTVSFVLHKKS